MVADLEQEDHMVTVDMEAVVLMELVVGEHLANLH